MAVAVSDRRGMGTHSGVGLDLCVMSSPLQSSVEGDWNGSMRWSRQARTELYLWGHLGFGSQAEVAGSGDQRQGFGGGGSAATGSSARVFGGRDAERLAVRAAEATRGGDCGVDASEEKGGERRSTRRVGASGRASSGRGGDAGLQSSAAPGSAAGGGTRPPFRGDRCGASVDSTEVSVLGSGYQHGCDGVRPGGAGAVAEGAEWPAPTAGTDAVAAAGPRGTDGGGSGAMAPDGVEGAPDYPEAFDGAGDGPDPQRAGGGDRSDTGAVPETPTVLELLRSGGGDSLFLGLEAGEEGTGACAEPVDSGVDAEAAAPSECGLQRGGGDGDLSAAGGSPSRPLS